MTDLCQHCDRPKSDPHHIRYGADENNPLKHSFETWDTQSAEIDRLRRQLAETILLWRSGENPNDYPEHAILDGGHE